MCMCVEKSPMMKCDQFALEYMLVILSEGIFIPHSHYTLVVPCGITNFLHDSMYGVPACGLNISIPIF